MASTQLQRTSGTSTENYKYTFSAWVKRTGVLGSSSVNEVLFSSWDGSSNSAYIRFEDQNDNLQVYDKYGSVIDLNYQTDMKFRDSNAWYHIVVDVDGTRSANQRCKIYVNGSQVSCSNTTDSGGTLAMKTVTATNATRLGAIRTSGGAEYYFNGLMSHVHYIDGTGYDASYFGETDSTTGEWKIKTDVTGVTYGNNGFFVLKDGNSVTDQSGNSNNFTVGGGTLTKTEDNPSNVFATLNPLFYSADITLSNGNTKAVEASNNWRSAYSNIGHSTGKFYAEAKITYQSGNEAYIGVAHEDHMNGTATYGGSTSGPNSGGYDYIGYSNKSVGIYSNGQQHYPSTVQTTASFQSNGDIIGIAVDIPGNKFYLSKNGQWNNAAGNAWDSTTFDASVGAISWTSKWTSGQVFVGCSPNESTWEWNFGNGYFGTTAVSSAGTNASGIGIFEYDVPTGFTAWSTKGLNE